MSDDKDSEDGAKATAGGGDASSPGESSSKGSGPSAAASDGDAKQAKAVPAAGSSAKSRSKKSEASSPEGTTEAKPAADDADRMDLPKWNRARVKRKQVKGAEQDAFQKSVRTAGRTALTRAPVVLALICLVAAVIAGVVWWQDHQQEKRATATRMLAQAVGFRARAQVADVEALMADRERPFPIPLVNDEQERREKVSEALQQLEEDAPDSPAAELAALVEAARAMESGEFADATQRYRAFAEAHPEHELVYLAHEGVVLGLEAQGDLEGALAATQGMIGESGDFYRDQGLYHKARLLEATGKTDEAIEVYRQYAEEFPLDKASIPRATVIERVRELVPDLVPEDENPAGGPVDLSGLGLP